MNDLCTKKLMKSVIIFSVLSVIGILDTYSQLSVRGTFYTTDKKPIEYALVTFYQNDSIIVKQAFTNEKGEFEVSLRKGSYDIQVKTLGALIYNSHVDISLPLDLGIVIVDPTINLKEVTIIYKKKVIERKIDRVVFNIENSSIALSGNAFDALKATPNIRVENDAISIVGKSTLQVMINGNIVDYSGDDLTNYLKTISSDRIKSIEIITNPPSKYEVEGNSGLINIVLKKSKNNTWDGSVRTIYTQSTYPFGGFYNNINISIGRFSLNNNMSYGLGNLYSIENMKTYTDKQIWNQNSKIKRKLSNMSANLATEYVISPKWAVGASYVFIKNVPHITHNNTCDYINNVTLLTDLSLLTNSFQKSKICNSSYNIYSKIQLDTRWRN